MMAYRTVISGNTPGYSEGYEHDRMNSICVCWGVEKGTKTLDIKLNSDLNKMTHYESLVTLSNLAESSFCLMRNWGLDGGGGLPAEAEPPT